MEDSGHTDDEARPSVKGINLCTSFILFCPNTKLGKGSLVRKLFCLPNINAVSKSREHFWPIHMGDATVGTLYRRWFARLVSRTRSSGTSISHVTHPNSLRVLNHGLQPNSKIHRVCLGTLESNKQNEDLSHLFSTPRSTVADYK